MNFNSFDLNNLKTTCSINLIMWGYDYKYNVVKKILNINDHIPMRLGIARLNNIYNYINDFVKNQLIYDQYSPDILKRVFSRHKIMKKQNLDSGLILLTWDCFNYIKSEDKYIKKLANKYSKYNITWLDVNNAVRPKLSNIYKSYDWVIFGSIHTLSERKIIYERHFQFIKSFDTFLNIFTNLTESYGLLVLNNKLESDDMYKKIYKLESINITSFYSGDYFK